MLQSVKISELPSADTLTEDDLIVVDQPDDTKKATLFQVLNHLEDTVEQSVLVELAQPTGAGKSGLMKGGTVQDALTFLTPGMVSSDPYTNFGTAMIAAFQQAMAQGYGEIRIPAGVYTLDRTIDVTLSRSMTLVFSPDAYIYVTSPMTAFKININAKHLNITANGARIMSNWGSTTSASPVYALHLIDASLDKSCSVTDFKVGYVGASKFDYAIRNESINLGTFHRCLLQGKNGIYLESNLANGASAHAMGCQFIGNEIYVDADVFTIANQGALGCEGLIIADGQYITSGTAIRISNVGLTSSSYLPPLVRILNNHINAYQGLYVKDVSRLFVVGNDFQTKYNLTTVVKGIIELGGVQVFEHHGNAYSAVGYGGADATYKATPVYQFASTLTNAFFNSTGNVYWLPGMTKPAYDFESAVNVTRVLSANETLNSAGTWVSSSYKNLITLAPHASIGNNGAASGLDYSSDATFSGGVLTLGSTPPQGFTYNIGTSVVPNSSVITQIVSPAGMVGKEINLLFSAAEVTFTHGVNMICPDQKSAVMSIPNVVKVFAFNTTQTRIMDIGGNTTRRIDITSAPTSKTSAGYHGAEFFDTATKRYYKYFVGYGWVYTTMTDIP